MVHIFWTPDLLQNLSLWIHWASLAAADHVHNPPQHHQYLSSLPTQKRNRGQWNQALIRGIPVFSAFCYRMASFIYLLSNPNFNQFHFLQELKKITVILKNFSTVRNRLLQFLPMRDQRRDGLLYLLRFWVTQGHQLISSLLINMWQTMLNIFILTNIRTNKYRISDYWANLWL